MKKSTLAKIIAALLCVSLLLNLMPLSAFAVTYDDTVDDYYNVISQKDWELAPGITESEIVLNNDEGSRRQVVHLMEADLNNPYTKVISSYAEMNYQKFQTSTMDKQAAWIEENTEYNVVGAMNTTLSWYNTSYYFSNPDQIGRPLAFTMLDGEVVWSSSEGFKTVLVINKDFDADGNPRPANIPKVEMVSITKPEDLDGWEEQVIPGGSGCIVQNGKNMQSVSRSDSAPRSLIGIKPDGKVIIMMNDGRQEPYSAGMNMYECAQVLIAAGCSYAFNCDGGGTSQFFSQRPGEELKANCSPSDGGLRPTTQGIVFISTAPATGTFEKVHISTDSDYYTPGSKVQFNAVGTDFVGTEAEIPADAVWQLEDPSFGTISNTGLFTSNGKEGDVTVQIVYEGAVVGKATVTIVLPEISFKQNPLILPYGEDVEISLNVTTNGGLNVVTTKPGDIVYTISDANMGTINDNFFATTSDTTVTGGTLTAVICGNTDGIATTEVKFGKASEIVYDFEDGYEVVVDKSGTGMIDPNGPDDSSNWVKGWHVSDIHVDIYHGYRGVAKNGRTPVGAATRGTVKLVDKETGKVRNGENALGVTLDWSTVTSMGAKQLNIWFPEAIDVTDANMFGMWIYLPDYKVLFDNNNSFTFRLVGKTSAGTSKNLNVAFKDLFKNCCSNDEGWYYLTYDVSELVTVDYFHMFSTDQPTSVNAMPKLTFYIDDITVDYSDAVIDREIPYFTNLGYAINAGESTVIDGQTITTNTIDLIAQANENTTKSNYTGLNTSSVKVTVDGVEVPGAVCAINGTITLSGLKLEDGTHTIRVEIADNQGNFGSISKKLTVNSDKSAVRLELADPDYALLPAGSLMYFNIVADDIKSVQSVTTKIKLDGVNEWDLEGLSTAYGFAASYTVNDNNDAVITITRTGDEIDEDTNILAKFPVRTWMTKSYLDPDFIATGYVTDDQSKQDKYWVLTPDAMWLTDGVFVIHVIADASEGVVTYTDGTQGTFSSNEFEVSTELNRYRNVTTEGYDSINQGKASFHIHIAGKPTDKVSTCTETGYTGRVFCVGCSCRTEELYAHECDTADGCGSVLEWGEIIPRTKHNYIVENKQLVCSDCNSVYKLETGLVTVNGNTYYSISGKLVSGWQLIGEDYYYFDDVTLTTVETYNNGLVTFEFDSTGKVLSGQWYKTASGLRYYYGPAYYKGSAVGDLWKEIDGKTYCFPASGYAYTGYHYVHGGYSTIFKWYDFGEDGALVGPWNYTGLAEADGFTYCVVDGVSGYGMYYMDGAYYYCASANRYAAVKNIERHCPVTNGLLPVDTYRFGADGKLLDNVICCVDNTLYYYVLGKVSQGTGTVNINGQDWNVEADGKVLFTGVCKDANGVEQNYVDGVYTYVAKNGVYDGYLYIDDVKQKRYQLAECNGDYYFINDGDKVAKNVTLYLSDMYVEGKTYPDGTPIQPGLYSFDDEGKMIVLNGVVGDYLYINGIAQKRYQLMDFDGNYYFINDGNKVAKNITLYLSDVYVEGKTYPDGTPIQAGLYNFDAEGKMVILNGVVGDYLYINGIAQKRYQLMEFDGNYYFINDGDKVAKNITLYLGENFVAGKTYPDGTSIQPGYYNFDAEGKMVILNGVVGDYLYINGIAQKRYQLMEFEGNYYFINDGDRVAKNTVLYLGENFVAGKTYPDGTPIQPGLYDFDAEGKMVILNGVVGDYFYINGIAQKRYQLIESDGNYYFINDGDKVAKNIVLYLGANFVEGTDIQPGLYHFDADGRMIVE